VYKNVVAQFLNLSGTGLLGTPFVIARSPDLSGDGPAMTKNEVLNESGNYKPWRRGFIPRQEEATYKVPPYGAFKMPKIERESKIKQP